MSRFVGRIALLLAALTGCTFNEITVPSTKPGIVVHGVLNPVALSQVILLERTLTGAVQVTDSLFDPNNPIASAGGVPINGATVEIVDSTGRVLRGTEDKTAGGSATGVYRIPTTIPLRLGARYQLHVHTLDGEDVTAATRIPRPDATSAGALTRTFNRDHDTLFLAWNRATSARAYAIRVESPFGPFFMFTDSTGLRLPGNARNLFANNLERLFIPGFRQDALVAAVDSNFYDY